MNKHVKGGGGNWGSVGVSNRGFEPGGGRLHSNLGTMYKRNKNSVDMTVVSDHNYKDIRSKAKE